MNVESPIEGFVVVLDDYVPVDYVDSLVEEFESMEQYLAFILHHDGTREYDEGTGVYQTRDVSHPTYYTEFLMGSPVFNLSSPHEFTFRTKLHRMEVGSTMNKHTDQHCSYAVTTYLTDCEGGELYVEDPRTGEVVSIRPRAHRTVVMEAGIPHWVSEVRGGTRKSLQTFVQIEPLL